MIQKSLEVVRTVHSARPSPAPDRAARGQGDTALMPLLRHETGIKQDAEVHRSTSGYSCPCKCCAKDARSPNDEFGLGLTLSIHRPCQPSHVLTPAIKSSIVVRPTPGR